MSTSVWAPLANTNHLRADPPSAQVTGSLPRDQPGSLPRESPGRLPREPAGCFSRRNPRKRLQGNSRKRPGLRSCSSGKSCVSPDFANFAFLIFRRSPQRAAFDNCLSQKDVCWPKQTTLKNSSSSGTDKKTINSRFSRR